MNAALNALSGSSRRHPRARDGRPLCRPVCACVITEHPTTPAFTLKKLTVDYNTLKLHDIAVIDSTLRYGCPVGSISIEGMSVEWRFTTMACTVYTLESIQSSFKHVGRRCLTLVRISGIGPAATTLKCSTSQQPANRLGRCIDRGPPWRSGQPAAVTRAARHALYH